MFVQAKWARCTNTVLEEHTLEGSGTEESPQSELSITGPASHGWESSETGEQETLCIHVDVSQSFLAR